jgi:hypothetical protein
LRVTTSKIFLTTLKIPLFSLVFKESQ